MGWSKGSNPKRLTAESAKVKTFTSELKIFETMRQLASLDDQVNRFLKEKKINKVVGVSDTTTTDNTGASIGLIRVLAYEE